MGGPEIQFQSPDKRQKSDIDTEEKRREDKAEMEGGSHEPGDPWTPQKLERAGGTLLWSL